jgi:glutamate racemase
MHNGWDYFMPDSKQAAKELTQTQKGRPNLTYEGACDAIKVRWKQRPSTDQEIRDRLAVLAEKTYQGDEVYDQLMPAVTLAAERGMTDEVIAFCTTYPNLAISAIDAAASFI